MLTLNTYLKQVWNEGGNIFTGTGKATEKIARENIEPTIKKFAEEFRKVFPAIELDFSDVTKVARLGSVGLKDISGDIDLGIDAHDFINEDGSPKFEALNISEEAYDLLFAKFKKASRTAADKQIMLRSVLTLMSNRINEIDNMIVSSDKDVSGGAIFCSFPQFTPDGTMLDKNVQIDVNVGPLTWLKFSYYSSGQFTGNLKGLHRTQLIAAIFDALGYSFRHETGILKDGQIVASSPDEAIAILNKHGININKTDINDFDKVCDAVDKSNVKDLVYEKYLKGRLDNMRDSDIPERMQDWWIANRDRLGMRGTWLPESSKIWDKLPKEEVLRLKQERATKDAEKMAKAAKKGIA